MPRVSILMPSYNHEKYVSAAIRSALMQTYQDYELIIVDDNSSDNSVGVIERFSDKRIKLLRSTQNQGQFAAMQRCIEEATGEFVAVLNSDDVFMPEKLARQVAVMESRPEVGAVFSYSQLIDERGKPFVDKQNFYFNVCREENRSRFEWLNHFFWKGNCLIHSSAMIRKECHNQLGTYKPYMQQLSDFDFWVQLCLAGYQLHIIPEDLVKFRILSQNANLSGNKPETVIRCGWEQTIVLENYLRIPSLADFYAIFPEARTELGEYSDPVMIPYLLGSLAIRSKWTVTQYFGMRLLFEIASKEDLLAKINRYSSFTYKDLRDLSGKLDVFRLFAYEESERCRLELQQALSKKRESTHSLVMALFRRTLVFKVLKRLKRFLVART